MVMVNFCFQSPEACDVFPIDVKEATAGLLKAEMRLGKKLDYNKRSLYQFMLTASVSVPD
jgi:hypothetical protein